MESRLVFLQIIYFDCSVVRGTTQSPNRDDGTSNQPKKFCPSTAMFLYSSLHSSYPPCEDPHGSPRSAILDGWRDELYLNLFTISCRFLPAPSVETHICWNSLSYVCTVGAVMWQKKLVFKKKTFFLWLDQRLRAFADLICFEFWFEWKWWEQFLSRYR